MSFETLPQASAAEGIAARLTDAIHEHRVLPGAKLPEEEVCEIFGVGRTVVRQALHALSHDGLVAIERNRGAFVARPSVKDAREVFEARALLEPRMARAAAERATVEAFVRQLVSRSSLVIALYWRRRNAMCESHAHHALLGALRRGDGADAEEQMKGHLLDLLSQLDLREHPEEAVSLAAALRG